jgi:hypothetical protein
MTNNSDEIENQEVKPEIKPEIKPKEYKRNMTDEQRQQQKEHLNKIREMAMKKKLELKEITLKSKLAKTIPKQELAKQYDEYITNKVITEKTKPKKEENKEEEEEEEVIVKKPKSKPKKKIVYISESESEEEVIVRKPKSKPKPQPLEHLVYNNTKDALYQRMIEERVKASIIGYGNALGI